MQIKQSICKECGGDYYKSTSLQKVCSPRCALEHGRKKVAKNDEKQRKERKREFMANDVGHQKKVAQKAFNAFIRERDKNEGCISCDKPSTWGGQWHAGHFKTVGARSDLRFNEDNCHKQCSVCNNYDSGNLINYKENLIKKIGQNRADALDADPGPNKMTASDYAEITKEYKSKLKSLRCNVQEVNR